MATKPAGAKAPAPIAKAPTGRRPAGRGRIVAVRFEDGTELPCNDDNLRRYLKARDDEAMCNALIGQHSSMATRESFLGFVNALQAVHREEKSAKNTAVARQPRSEFARRDDAREQLMQFKSTYEASNGRAHGWKTAACKTWLIDISTLNTILARSSKAD